jgi:NADH:ubiquinone oxidoreductase subunit K
MTHSSVPPADDPNELLMAMRDLTRQVRAAQRGTWFPLLVFAVITLAVIPLYRYAPAQLSHCRSGPGGTSTCAAVIPGVLVYWPAVLVLAYAVIAGFYVRQSRRRGVGTRIRPYVVAGIVIAVLLAAVSLGRAFHPLLPGASSQFHVTALTLVTPETAIGLALLVLVWVERNLLLLAFSLVYLVIVLIEEGRVLHSSSPWYFLPQLLIPATVLLLGSAGFALFRLATERRP